MNQSNGIVDGKQSTNDFLFDQIADALGTQGYMVLNQALPGDILADLYQLSLDYETQGMKPAGIGRGQDFQQNAQIRSDYIRWLTGDAEKESAFLSWMDELRFALNQRLFMGLQTYESHFAFYPAGAFYQKHFDAFKGKSGRKVSTVLYLNQSWPLDAGGELVVYHKSSDQVLLEVIPEYGNLVIFLSEEFPHEVKLANRNRRSIAGWFKIQESNLVI